jgi:hypothetical protein
MKTQFLLTIALISLMIGSAIKAADPAPQPESTSLVSARNGGLLALGGLGLASLYRTGLLSKIQNHMRENRLATCVITVVAVGAGAHELYRKFHGSANSASTSFVSKVEDSVFKDEGRISDQEEYEYLNIPGLCHIASANVTQGRGAMKCESIVYADSFLNLKEKEVFTKKTFKDLILAAQAQGKPYILVRITYFNQDMPKYGYTCRDGIDIPAYFYEDAQEYEKAIAKVSSPRVPAEVVHIQIRHIDGEFVAQVIEAPVEHLHSVQPEGLLFGLSEESDAQFVATHLIVVGPHVEQEEKSE